MALRKISTIKKGFTLIEMLIVVGLFTLLGSLTLFMSMDAYRSISVMNDRDTVVLALQHARSAAMNSVCISPSCMGGVPHGIHIEGKTLTAFEGQSFALRNVSADEVVELRYGKTTLSGFNEALFAHLSGDASTSPSGQWSLSVVGDSGTSSVISLNSEGQIAWSN